ncbi:MAG: small multi-drug export protein [Clostridia bacterium]|nr:small multi-drug export protein [Clostridia bacterium]
MFDLLNQFLPAELSVFIISMFPIVELRGAIPLGVGLGMSPFKAMIIAILGNSMIVPILLLIINPLFYHFKKLTALRGFFTRYEERAARKIHHYRQYRLLGLFLLVAIPLPMTGAYTGCVAAVITKISFRKASAAIIAGVITAGIVVYTLTYYFHVMMLG